MRAEIAVLRGALGWWQLVIAVETHDGVEHRFELRARRKRITTVGRIAAKRQLEQLKHLVLCRVEPELGARGRVAKQYGTRWLPSVDNDNGHQDNNEY